MGKNLRMVGTANIYGHDREAVVLQTRYDSIGNPEFLCAFADRKGILRREWVKDSAFTPDQAAPIRAAVLAL